MTDKEKIFLIQCLLKDVRGNWADPIEPRVTKAKELCEELGGDFLQLAKECEYFIQHFDGWLDGRFFRGNFPYGYIGMDSLHNLPITYKDKSEEFKDYVDDFITYPDFLFTDF